MKTIADQLHPKYLACLERAIPNLELSDEALQAAIAQRLRVDASAFDALFSEYEQALGEIVSGAALKPSFRMLNSAAVAGVIPATPTSIKNFLADKKSASIKHRARVLVQIIQFLAEPPNAAKLWEASEAVSRIDRLAKKVQAPDDPRLWSARGAALVGVLPENAQSALEALQSITRAHADESAITRVLDAFAGLFRRPMLEATQKVVQSTHAQRSSHKTGRAKLPLTAFCRIVFALNQELAAQAQPLPDELARRMVFASNPTQPSA